MAQSAKLQALHYQINPHFLFNSFNAVSALILDGRADDANAMVERLASFFRVNLATNPDVDISLAEEIALQTTYLEIEQTRYPDLDIRIDLPAALARAAVPAFLLQPQVRFLHDRSEEHTSELQSLMRNSYAVFCLKKKQQINYNTQ